MDSADVPDAELVQRVRGGERAAFAELIRRHESRLRTFLSFYHHTREELEERLQESFVQSFIALGSYDPSAEFYPWLRGIAFNTLKMEFRRLQTAKRRGADYLRFIQLQRLEREPPAQDDEARAEALRGCLGKLPEDDVRLIQARYAEACALKVLAERFASTEGALKVRLLRLRHALRLCIQRTIGQAERA